MLFLEYCMYITNKYALNMSAVVRVYSLSIDKREKSHHLTQDFFLRLQLAVMDLASFPGSCMRAWERGYSYDKS